MHFISRSKLAPLVRASKGYLLGAAGLPGFLLRSLTMRKRPVGIVLSVGGPHSGSAWITERVAKLGYRPVVLSPSLPLRELRYAAGWVKIDSTREPAKAAQAASKLGAKIVVSDHTNALLAPVARMQELLGLRGLGSRSPESSNDKRIFRQALDNAGAQNLKWAVINDLKEPPLEFPFILKPSVGTGSLGVIKVRNQEEFERVVSDKFVKPDQAVWIAEEFVLARQFDVEGVAQDGEYTVFSITEEHYTETAGRFPSTWFLFSPPVPEEWKNVLTETARATLAACGVQNGAFHCELRLTKELRCVPIDYSNRYGYPMMVSECAGTDFIGAYVSTLSEKPFKPLKIQKNTVFQQYASSEEQRAIYLRLIRENPQNVIEARMLGSLVGGVETFGRISLRSKSFADMTHLLDRYGLMPEIWRTFYSESLPPDLKDNA